MIFPPAFLDSSSWNDNQQQQQQAHHQVAGGGGGGGDGNHELLQPSIMGGALPAAGLAPAGSTSSACATTNVPALQGPAMLGGNLSMLPPLLRLADFDAMSLGSSFSGMAGKPSLDAAGAYSVGGGSGLEHQWRVQQMQSFPFLHAMDQGPLGPPLAMTMAPGMFQLGLDSGDGRGGGGGSGEDGSGELHVMQAKREGGYQARGMYGDHHFAAAGYASYSNNAAAGNHLL